MKLFRAFVVGTDTGVGKTQVACALLSLLADRGDRPAPFKPYESGVVRKNAPEDALALLSAAQSDDTLDTVCPHRFRAPLAPGIAASRLGQEPSWDKTLAVFGAFAARSLIAEAAGGLRVPLDGQHDVIDLVAHLRLPVVLVARSGLGTLNHTALSLDALFARQITVLAVVLSRSRQERDPSERDNREWIARRHGVPVLGPVPFETIATRRRAAFRRALRPLLDS
jgi:dethiobiotin synthetase